MIRVSITFQSTRPVWGVTLCGDNDFTIIKISIHTPRVGRDDEQGRFNQEINISIHTPRVGRDSYDVTGGVDFMAFQSTRPVWGVTKLQA